MNIEQLKEHLPHREPMLLIDSARENDDGTVSAASVITGDEWFVKGHFPGKPIVPGVILCEMMAQACGLLLKERLKGCLPLFAGINNVKFKNIVKPGDTLNIECRLIKDRHPFYAAQAEGYVGGKLSVSGDFSFMITAKGENGSAE